MPDPTPQRDAILAALERLLEWPDMVRSPQLARFLDYIVRQTVDGDEQSIKAYAIAVDVFGRSVDFDPQSDPIVRVQARRLRALLDEYYRSVGADDPVRVELPVGRYVPEFRLAGAGTSEGERATAEPSTESEDEQGRGITLSWFALLVITIGVAMAAVSLSTWGPRQEAQAAAGLMRAPSVTVMEFQNLAPAGPGAPMAGGLAIELVTDLDAFGTIDARYGTGADGTIPDSDFVLTGIVRPDGPLVQYSVILTQTAAETVVWNRTISVPVPEAADPGVLDRVSQALGLVLGSPRGPLHEPARTFLQSGTDLVGRESPYLCGVLFDLYRETGDAGAATRTHACMLGLPEAERGGAWALAADASLVADYPSPAVSALATQAERMEAASAELGRAVAEAPLSGFVWEQQARLFELRRDPQQARAAYSSSIQLNPANADALAAYARLLALNGDLAAAEGMARDAIDSSRTPPAWYYGVPALLALRDQLFEPARDHAARYAEADAELGPILAIMAGLGARDSAVVNRYLPQVLDVAEFRSRGVLPRLRDRISDDALIETIRAALLEAGVPPAALTGSF